MSDYNKTEWVNGTAPAINANNLNKMEIGIEDAHVEIQELVDGTVKVGHAILADELVGGAVVPGTAPAGSVSLMASANVPEGWFECDGQAISRSEYLDLFNEIGTIYGTGNGSTTFSLPDMRGEFIRGWNHNRADADPTVDRTIGSAQAEDLLSHVHSMDRREGYVSPYGGMAAGTAAGPLSPLNTSPAGGVETRPRNIAMMYVIKA